MEIELGVMLTVHDVGGIFHDAEGAPLLSLSRQSHLRNPLCLRIDRERCIRHCLDHVNARCRMAGSQSFISQCWAGMVEVCVSLRWGGLHIGTLSAGIWRTSESSGQVPDCFSKSQAMTGAYSKLPLLHRDRAQRLSLMLVVCADGLMVELEHLQHLDKLPGDRRGEIIRFVTVHANQQVSIGELANIMNLSPSRAGHVVKELFGVPLSTLLQRERLHRARTLLRTTDFPVKEIARRSGFSDPFRFSRVFRKVEGKTPGNYRKRFQPS